jgi:hypothetical protein
VPSPSPPARTTFPCAGRYTGALVERHICSECKSRWPLRTPCHWCQRDMAVSVSRLLCLWTCRADNTFGPNSILCTPENFGSHTVSPPWSIKTTTNRGVHSRLIACPCDQQYRQTGHTTSPWHVLQLNFLDGRSDCGVTMVCKLPTSPVRGGYITCAPFATLLRCLSAS